MVNQNEIINIATINLNGETWSSINRRPRLPQKLYDIQHIKEELTKSTKEGIKIILEKDIYDIIAVQELVFSEKEGMIRREKKWQADIKQKQLCMKH